MFVLQMLSQPPKPAQKSKTVPFACIAFEPEHQAPDGRTTIPDSFTLLHAKPADFKGHAVPDRPLAIQAVDDGVLALIDPATTKIVGKATLDPKGPEGQNAYFIKINMNLLASDPDYADFIKSGPIDSIPVFSSTGLHQPSLMISYLDLSQKKK